MVVAIASTFWDPEITFGRWVRPSFHPRHAEVKRWILYPSSSPSNGCSAALTNLYSVRYLF